MSDNYFLRHFKYRTCMDCSQNQMCVDMFHESLPLLYEDEICRADSVCVCRRPPPNLQNKSHCNKKVTHESTPGKPLCESKKSCASCVENTNCGWCETRNSCFEGDLTGPHRDQCSAEKWNFNFCSSLDCSG